MACPLAHGPKSGKRVFFFASKGSERLLVFSELRGRIRFVDRQGHDSYIACTTMAGSFLERTQSFKTSRGSKINLQLAATHCDSTVARLAPCHALAMPPNALSTPMACTALDSRSYVGQVEELVHVRTEDQSCFSTLVLLLLSVFLSQHRYTH